MRIYKKDNEIIYLLSFDLFIFGYHNLYIFSGIVEILARQPFP